MTTRALGSFSVNVYVNMSTPTCLIWTVASRLLENARDARCCETDTSDDKEIELACVFCSVRGWKLVFCLYRCLNFACTIVCWILYMGWWRRLRTAGHDFPRQDAHQCVQQARGAWQLLLPSWVLVQITLYTYAGGPTRWLIEKVIRSWYMLAWELAVCACSSSERAFSALWLLILESKIYADRLG